ncbi:MAG: hypothetical protein A2Y17_02895 [Clostridiales bacterium GWF2_38_85]|nr:MAG: hypothetical protein A2Y17_02895 [Clostridiales bacterium GWF2_38_85]
MPFQDNNIEIIENELQKRFINCCDFNNNRINCDEAVVGIYFFSYITERIFMTDRIIKSIIDKKDKIKEFNGKFEALIPVNIFSDFISIDDSVIKILDGYTLVCIQIKERCYLSLCKADDVIGRSVSNPNTEGALRGSYSAFVEDIRKNIAMMRQILRTDKLKIEQFIIGKLSNTRIAICYIEGRAKKQVIDEVKRRIFDADITSVMDSAYIEIAFEKSPSLFRTAGSTEKPDKACSKLISGRVAIVVDGSPFVLTVPYIFVENLQSTEDYLKSPIYSTFIRTIRFIAILISVYLPSVFIAAVSDDIKLLPLELLLSISTARRNIAYSLFGEILLMLIIFEIIREVGIRMPKSVGNAVGIVGSIILGDAAVKAGIASTTVIIVVALTAISNFVLPPYVDSTVILRFGFLFAAYFLSFFGIFALTLIILTRLCSKDSFGTPYMMPISPLDKEGLSDFITVVPKKVLGRAEKGVTKDK